MANLLYRSSTSATTPASTTAKNAPLTNLEVDGNFKSINDDLILRAPLASPSLTGTPTAPTAAVNTNTTQIATTAYVVAQIADDAPTKTGTGASGTWGISITGSAVNIAGGLVGYIPYQTAANTTALLAPGTAGYALISNGNAAPSWQKITAGAQGGSDTNAVFFENDSIVTANYTVSANKNAGSFGPITVNNGVTVTIPDGSIWTIV